MKLCFLTVAGRRIAAGITFEYGDTLAYYNAGVDPDARELSPGVVMVAKYVERAIATGRHRLDFLRGDEPYKYEWGAVDEPIQRLLVRRGGPMSAPAPGDPCLEPVQRPIIPGGRVRVVEVLATGTNGGAQEHVLGLLTRLDPARYDVHVISLSQGSSIRKLERNGIPVTVIDEPDDAIATGAVAALLAELRPEVVHNHMYRAELVGTRAAIALGEVGQPRPYIVSTVHSSRVRSEEDRRVLRLLTPRIDRLIAVSRSIVDKLHHEGRDAAPISLIHNGVDLERYDHQGPCCTLREEYGLPSEVRSSASWPGSSRRRATRRCSRRGRRSWLPCRMPPCSSSVRAAGARPSRRWLTSWASPTGSSSPAGATTSRP